MGKSLKGKELGRGLYQRSDGLYVARIYTKGSPKPIYVYDSNLAKLKKKRDHEKAILWGLMQEHENILLLSGLWSG